MTDNGTTPKRQNVADIYRGTAAVRGRQAASPQKLRPLKPLTRADEHAQKPAVTVTVTATQTSGGQKQTSRRSNHNPHAGRPVVSVRMTTDLLARFEATCVATGMTPLELTFTAVSDALPDLPAYIAEDNAAKRASQPRTAPATQRIGGGLFELPDRQTNTTGAPATVHRMWRTTQQNMDSIDQIVVQVGARDRQQVLQLSLTHYLEHKEPPA